MKIITQRELLNGIAERWLKYYYPGGGVWKQQGAHDVYDRLLALQKPVQLQDAVDILKTRGREEWVLITCEECERDVEIAVVLGGYSDSFVNMCAECLRKALLAIDPAFAASEQHRIESELNAA